MIDGAGLKCSYCEDDFYIKDERFPGSCPKCINNFYNQAFAKCAKCQEIWGYLDVADSPFGLELEPGKVYTTSRCFSCSLVGISDPALEVDFKGPEGIEKMLNFTFNLKDKIRAVTNAKNTESLLRSHMNRSVLRYNYKYFKIASLILSCIHSDINSIYKQHNKLFFFLPKDGARKNPKLMAIQI